MVKEGKFPTESPCDMRRQWMNYGDVTGDSTATVYQFACGSVAFFAPGAPNFSFPAQRPVQIAYYGAVVA